MYQNYICGVTWVFLPVTPFCYDPLLHFLQNRFSFLPSAPSRLHWSRFPFNTHFSKNYFTTIPILSPQLLKPGFIQVPWDFVAHSIAMKGFQLQGHFFGQKTKRSKKNLFLMMLKNTAWRRRVKTGNRQFLFLLHYFSLICMWGW